MVCEEKTHILRTNNVLMGRSLLKKALGVILTGLLLYKAAFAATVVETDFSSDWAGLSFVGSSWSLDPTGGPDGSPCAKLDPIDGNHGHNVIEKNVLSYNTDEYWVEFNFKMTGSNVKGGSKFVKFEGKDTDADFGNDNNLTYGIEQYSGTLRDISYYMDTICKASYDGEEMEWWGDHCKTLDYVVTSGPITPNDNLWHHFKVYVRRADAGVANGVSRIWYDGVEVFHAYNMESNPLGGDATGLFDNITLMGYIATTGKNAWLGPAAYGEIYVDNLYIGTTEKVAGPDTTSPAIDNPQPAGTLPMGSSQATISVSATDPSGVAGCNFDTVDVAYDNMSGTLTNKSGNTWEATVSGLDDGLSYTYYVRCIDSLDNVSAGSVQISFAVSNTISAAFAWEQNSYSVSEGVGTASFRIVRSGSTSGTGAIDWGTLGDTAQKGQDYTGVDWTTVYFVDGETAKQVSVTIHDDTDTESNETFTITLAHPVSGNLASPSDSTVTIVDNDGVPQTICYQDVDGDRYSQGTCIIVADPSPCPVNYYAEAELIAIHGDCNDNNAGISPGTVEICGNGMDEDCNGADLTCSNTRESFLLYMPAIFSPHR